MCDIIMELLDFSGVSTGVGDSRNSGCGYLNDFISHVCKFADVRGGVGGGENHPNVEGKALQEKFTEEEVGHGRCAELVPEELLHTSEQLFGFAVAKLFSTNELLQLMKFRGCSTFN